MSLESVENKVISIMEKIGHDFKVGLAEVVKYLPEASVIASLIFPSEAAPIAATVNVVRLIQSAVTSIEQKYAAMGAATGTGAQKLADVLTIVTPTVTQLLASEKISIPQTQITSIVNAVVAILNAQTTTVAAAPVKAPQAPGSPDSIAPEAAPEASVQEAAAAAVAGA